ncbi:MAG: phosphopentomutase [Bdellovibrio sp.]|nr:phosphopentomutase [Bdellovibrio sp.]
MKKHKRVIWIVLDGVGAGELPDAATYGDQGSDTLGNLSRSFLKQLGRPLSLPNLQNWGLGNITPMEGLPPLKNGEGIGAFGRAAELSRGKDTTSGHWEMAGLVLEKPFATYPNGFSDEVVNRWIQENHLPGVLGNCTASGTEIIDRFGAEHIRTGKPILYTSADSVWQVAAHEETFGLDRLYQVCKSARLICNDLQVGRVIARPFVGNPEKGQPFKRTYHRKDYAQKPFEPTYLDLLNKNGIATFGIGKISNIYAGQGVASNQDTEGNTDGLKVLLNSLKDSKRDGLIFCNLIDFDMLYGHRRDVKGFGLALEEFDQKLPELFQALQPDDLVLITADHGNDPTYRGTDHTREYVPILAYSPIYSANAQGALNLGTLESFADLGATVCDALLGSSLSGSPRKLAGQSFLKRLSKPQAGKNQG